MKKTFSVRRFLLVAMLGAVVALWAVAAFLSYRDARHEISELFDAQLAESAKVLLAQSAHEIYEIGNEGEVALPEDHEEHRYAQRLYFQIWDAQGNLLLRSGKDVPKTPLIQAASGYENRLIDGETYRVYSLWERHHRLQIQIAQRQSVRDRFSAELALHITLPLLLALPFLALLIGWGVNRGLRPLKQVAKQVSSREPDHLEPLSLEEIPVETQPLVDALNTLLSRLHGAIENERRFTSDASHELRTPLSALKTQVEVALGAASDENRTHALEQVLRAVDRMSHLVAQLLTLARLDPDATLLEKTSVDLRAVAADALRGLASEAIRKRIDLSLEDGEARVRGNAAMLGVLVGNLVGNAIRYTPENGKVQVFIQREGNEAILFVRDTGPGIPPEERARVFDRFYRLPGAPAEGSGLGLSIVKRIVEIHSGRIELGGPPGLEVRVFLPAE